MPGTLNLDAHSGVRRVVKDFFEEGKYIGAICAGPTVLANLGLLKGKRITCHPTVEQDIQGAVITKVPVTVDNNVITGRGAGAAVDFALKLIEVLAGSDKDVYKRQTLRMRYIRRRRRSSGQSAMRLKKPMPGISRCWWRCV